MMYGLTDEEQEFLRTAGGSWFASLNSFLGQPEDTPVSEAYLAAARLEASLTEQYPSRTERLLVFTAVAKTMDTARIALVKDIPRASINWTRRDDARPFGGEWVALALQTHEADWFATIAGVSRATILRWHRALSQEALTAAQAAWAESHPER